MKWMTCTRSLRVLMLQTRCEFSCSISHATSNQVSPTLILLNSSFVIHIVGMAGLIKVQRELMVNISM